MTPSYWWSFLVIVALLGIYLQIYLLSAFALMLGAISGVARWWSRRALKDVIYQLLGALRSGMSYCNAMTIDELHKNAEFIKITDAAFRESKSHNIQEID